MKINITGFVEARECSPGADRLKVCDSEPFGVALFEVTASVESIHLVALKFAVEDNSEKEFVLAIPKALLVGYPVR